MYSGTTFRVKSGRFMGVHQKIDRVARRHLAKTLPKQGRFPSTREILHFEGLNGPDGIKRKSPAKDEPWHYIDPENSADAPLLGMINDHIHNLAMALKNKNNERAAFEAAWLSHAIVDGLTPAHHYPLEEKLEELRGEGLETRTSTKEKILLPGKNRRTRFRNNWEFWGAKGVMTTHVAFEVGIATTIAPHRFDNVVIDKEAINTLKTDGYEKVFLSALNDIASMKMYEEFSKFGWTRHLAKETKNVLVPHIIKAVTLSWMAAFLLAKEANNEYSDH